MLANKNDFAKSTGFIGAILVWLCLEKAGREYCISFPISFEEKIFQLLCHG
jgi:hypothetical protein